MGGTSSDPLQIRSHHLFSLPHQFSQLITIQQKLGKDNFPLIEQTFYPNYKEMVSLLMSSLSSVLVQLVTSNFDVQIALSAPSVYFGIACDGLQNMLACDEW